MLTQLKKNGTEVSRATTLFSSFVDKNKVKCPGNVKKFIFLCGANKKKWRAISEATGINKFF